jgi:hypothetical protein
MTSSPGAFSWRLEAGDHAGFGAKVHRLVRRTVAAEFGLPLSFVNAAAENPAILALGLSGRPDAPSSPSSIVSFRNPEPLQRPLEGLMH